STTFDLWIDGISSRWPERLRFKVHAKDEACEVATPLIGKHWAPALAAALAAAQSLGVSLAEGSVVMGHVTAFAGRMQPVALPQGAVVIRDDYKSNLDGLERSLDFLREATATRKVLAITDFSDAGVSRKKRLKYLAASVSGWLDVLVLIGESRDYGRRLS